MQDAAIVATSDFTLGRRCSGFGLDRKQSNEGIQPVIRLLDSIEMRIDEFYWGKPPGFYVGCRLAYSEVVQVVFRHSCLPIEMCRFSLMRWNQDAANQSPAGAARCCCCLPWVIACSTWFTSVPMFRTCLLSIAGPTAKPATATPPMNTASGAPR